MSMSNSTKRKFLGLAVSGALLSGAGALAAPAPETTGTPPARTSPTNPTTSPSATTPAPVPSRAPSPETTPPPARGEEKRTDEGRPAADPMTTSPASPSGVLNERDVPGAATTMSPKAARDTERVLSDLHKANQLETALGALARTKASSDAVKEYAKELVESHQEADKKLGLYAQTHGLTLPGAPTGVTGSPADTAGTTSGMGSTTTPPRDLPTAGSPGAAPAGAATGAANRPGDVAMAGNPGTTAAGNPPVGRPGSVSPGAGDLPATAPTTASDVSPTTLDAEGRKLLAKLEKVDGEAFDKQFLTTMVRTHGKTLAKVKSVQSKKLEAELAGLVSDTRTMVENHLQRAKELQRPASASL
jgi:predicted outer membrane protein